MYEAFTFLGVFDYIAIMLIIFVGVHGAFDASVGMTLGFLNNWKSRISFIISLNYSNDRSICLVPVS